MSRNVGASANFAINSFNGGRLSKNGAIANICNAIHGDVTYRSCTASHPIFWRYREVNNCELTVATMAINAHKIPSTETLTSVTVATPTKRQKINSTWTIGNETRLPKTMNCVNTVTGMQESLDSWYVPTLFLDKLMFINATDAQSSDAFKIADLRGTGLKWKTLSTQKILRQRLVKRKCNPERRTMNGKSSLTCMCLFIATIPTTDTMLAPVPALRATKSRYRAFEFFRKVASIVVISLCFVLLPIHSCHS
mmetsp:Transcript_7036/g.21884  ORF Transcript_7036/g.21884 Transcript_7036/m.21884 type:complete len:252 (-) Transcript_7036:15-770(-)